MTNSSKYSKSTNFNKFQHSIYSKFQRYSIDSKQINFSYQQKAYHEHEKNEQNIENDENQKNNQNNFSFNFANLNQKNNEVYYEKQKIDDDEREIFIEFIDIESNCKRCELSFASRNLLHVHIREAKCLKQTILTNLDNSKIQNIVKIITFKASIKDQSSELKFRS